MVLVWTQMGEWGPGSVSRGHGSTSEFKSEMGSGDGRSRNSDTGAGFSGRGYGQRTGSFNRSDNDGTRSGPANLLGSPPFRPGMTTGSSGNSFGRQMSDEGPPRAKSPGASLLGTRPQGGNQYGMGRGSSSQGPRPLMSFESSRGRNDRGKFRGNWK